MTQLFEQRIRELSAADHASRLRGGRRGIEKESLRVRSDGHIADTPHPQILGSALTNKYVTTDYSEALLELVTPPEGSAWETLQFLCDIHQFVYESVGDELLWPFSMPCALPDEQDIPLAHYGTSNIGRMKTVYRRGLGHRYGRYMQVIAGMHFNYSLPAEFWGAYRELEGSKTDATDFRSAAYFGLVRNIRRLDWLLLYLFGASPTVSNGFIAGKQVELEKFDSETSYGPYATSLRMSNLGYQNKNQASLCVSANSLDEYVQDLVAAVETPNPDYEAIGAKVDGVHQQLNVNQLQIENEYYSTIRPKRVAGSGERPNTALKRAGVEYVELRVLDISPFDPVGINQAQIRFLETFLIYCLFLDSPAIEVAEQQNNQFNHAATATKGREPGLQLLRGDRQVALQDWGREVCEQMVAVCELLDGGAGGEYLDALRIHAAAIENSDQTPSARLIDELHQTGLGFSNYAMQMAQSYREYFLDLASDLNVHRELLETESRESLDRQRAIEESDDISFDDYVADYLA